MSDLRTDLTIALAAFGTQPLPVAAAGLFARLGYSSKRQMHLPSRRAFLAQFAAGQDDFAARFPDLAKSGSELVFLQQLTSGEISSNSSGQLSLLSSDKPDLQDKDSYLFLAYPLPATTYTHTDLSALARALNSLFAQPVLVLFHHGEYVSIAITNRRRSKTDASRDVVERKVTLIREIQLKEIKADVLWSGIIERQKRRIELQTKNPGAKVPDFIPAALVANVEMMRSTILNRLSHTGAPTLVKSEVEFALTTVGSLQAHQFPNVPKP